MMQMEWHGQAWTGTIPPLTLWLLLTSALALTILAVWLNAIILRKAGRSGWWSLLFLFPLLYLVGMWVFAFTRWPREGTSAMVPVPAPPPPTVPRGPGGG